MMNPEVMKHLVANPNIDLTQLPAHVKEIENGIREFKKSIPNVVKLVETKFSISTENYVKFELQVNGNDINVMVKEMKNLGEGKGDQFIKLHWSGELLELFFQLKDKQHPLMQFILNSNFNISVLLEHVDKMEGGLRLLKNSVPVVVALIDSEFNVSKDNYAKFELLPIGNDIIVTVKEMNYVGGGAQDKFIKLHWTGELLQLFLNLKDMLPFEIS